MQGLASIMTNPILQDGLSGLACTATAFAAIEVRNRLPFLSYLQSILQHLVVLSWSPLPFT